MTEHPNAYESIRLAALHRLERDKVDPVADLEGVRAVVTACVDAYQRRAHLGDGRALADPTDMTARVLASITDFGPLSDLFARSDVEEVFIEGSRVTFIDTTGRLQGCRTPTTEQENRQLVDRLLATTQRTLDASTPLVQARVLDGKARLTAAQDPISDGLSATIRRHLMKKETLRSLVDRGSLSMPAAGFLWALMQSTSSVVTSGPPGAGKTSLLSAMLGAVPSNHCVRCCEEIRELYVPLTHGAYYEARPPALDGSSEVSLRDLVKFVLTNCRFHHVTVLASSQDQETHRDRPSRRGYPHLCARRRRTHREVAGANALPAPRPVELTWHPRPPRTAQRRPPRRPPRSTRGSRRTAAADHSVSSGR